MASSGTIGKFNTGGNDYLIASTAFATCSTASSTAVKVATIQDGASFTLITGITVYVKFTYANFDTIPRLNVNSTGAITIVGAKTWDAGAVISFTYDGTNWVQHDSPIWDVQYDGTSVVSNGIASIPKELFICTQNTTTYAEISAAITAGKIPIVVDTSSGTFIAYYQTSASFADDPEHTFACFAELFGAQVVYLKCSSNTSLGTNGWYTTQYETTTTISDQSTNYEIPTALAVYNAIQSAGGSSLYYDQITLNTSSWSSNQQTATVSGMTSTAIVWVNPADDSKTYWTRANVRATSQSLDTLTFTCTDQELASYTSLNVNVVWTEPANQN